jgi:magnesium transporter
VSVVGIPPTLIASTYGMNCHYMPELAWRWGHAYGSAHCTQPSTGACVRRP